MENVNQHKNSEYLFGFSICPYCNAHKGFDYVHSHYQCKNCKLNIMPCCSGEIASNTNDKELLTDE